MYIGDKINKLLHLFCSIRNVWKTPRADDIKKVSVPCV